MTTGRPVAVLLAGATVSGDSSLPRALDAEKGRLEVVRRCVDLAELLACAAAGLADVAVVDDTLRRLDRDAVAQLHRHGLLVVVVCGPTHAETWRSCGADAVVTTADPAATVAAVLAVAAAAPPATSAALSGVGPSTAERRDPTQPPGRIVAVWGPVGSPGRTSVAITLADELARGGAPVLLVDADTYGSAVGVHLGLLDDTSGVAAATRLSAVGRLDAAALARAAVALPSGLAVLTGIARPGRWPELRPVSLQAVLQLAALHYAWVVVDVGFGLGSGVVPSAGLGPPDRDDATVATLAVCDSLVAVGSADTVGLVRLVRDLPPAVDAAPAAELCVVVNRVRRSTVGRRPTSQLATLLDAHVRADDLVLVPDDPHAFDLALCTGRTLAEVAADSAARDALRGLAGRFAPPAGHRSRRRPSLRRGLRRTG